MNEAETRAEHIDPALKAAGWGVVEGSRILREYRITLGRLEGLGRRAKEVKADYILVYRNHKLAVIEAKAWDESLTEGVAQAKNYSDKLEIRYAYSTNGREIYGMDIREGKEGVIEEYPTPEELWNRTFAEANAWRDRFAAVPFEDKGGYFQARYYQDLAIERVMEAIAADKSRTPTVTSSPIRPTTLFPRFPRMRFNGSSLTKFARKARSPRTPASSSPSSRPS